MIRKFSKFIVKNPVKVVLLIFALTFLFSFGIKNLKFENKLTEWLNKDDEVLNNFVSVSNKFSINNLVMVIVKPDEGVFNVETLKKIKDYTEKIKSRKEIYSVISMGNISDIRKVEDGIEVRDLLSEVPEERELKFFKNYVLSKDNYKNSVVSEDGEWVSFSLFLDEKYDPTETVKRIIIPETENYFGEKGIVYYSGMPSDSYYLNKFTVKDLRNLTPIIVFLVIAVLYASFRGIKGVLFPFLVVVLSNIWLFGLMGYIGKPLTLISPAIPVLLVALGSAYGIHVFNKILHTIDCETSDKKIESISKATEEILVPVLLAGLTTIVGFLSFFSAKLTLISEFGLFSATGIFFSLLISITLIPSLAVLLKFDREERESTDRGFFRINNLLKKFIEHKTLTAVVSILIVAFFIIGIFKVIREVNFSEYYPKNSIPRKGLLIVKDKFNGAYPLYIYLKAEDIKSPSILRIIRRTENFISTIRHTGTPFSVVDIIEELNSKLNDNYAIPERKGEIENLWLFIDGRDELKNIISNDYKEAIVFSKTAESTTKYNIYASSLLDSFVQSEFKSSFYYFNLKDLPYEKRAEILKKEADLLSDEILWINKKYSKRASVEKETIAKILTIMPEKNTFKSSTIKLFNKFLKKYILSDEFEFEISPEEGELFIYKILKQAKDETLSRKNLKRAILSIRTSDEKDNETVNSIVETLLFLKRKADTKVVFRERMKALLKLLKIDSSAFRDRVESIVYDSLDDIAVLKDEEVSGIKGKPIYIDKVFQSGIPAISARLDDSLFDSQIQSILIAYILTLFLMMLLRKNIMLGFVSTIPIVFTVSIMYGALGFLKIPLDYATMMIGGISIGVGIDYAIHFIHGYLEKRKQNFSKKESTYFTLQEKGKAILTNAFSVVLGFFVLLFSNVLPLKNFGGTMVAAMLLSAFSALTVLPVFLLIIEKIKKEENYD